MDRAQPIPLGAPGAGMPSGHVIELRDGWSVCSTSPGSRDTPAELESVQWRAATAPCTVASLAREGVGLEEHPDYDAHDWWFACDFADPRDSSGDGGAVRLRFDGLATLAQVWVNGTPVLQSENMFVAHRVDVTDLLRDENRVVIAFRSLTGALASRRPRPRWKTALVEQQRLRWFRTTLLGRIPGWTPPVTTVGPWRPVALEVAQGPELRTVSTRTSFENGQAGLHLRAEIDAPAGLKLGEASVVVDGTAYPLEVTAADGRWVVGGDVVVESVEPWWPHTHGTPHLYTCRLLVGANEEPLDVELGRVGFRTVRIDDSGGDIRFVVNGTPVFCRGACWTPTDPVGLSGAEADVRPTLQLLAEAHGNMVRVGGTMVYESDAFYRVCDELGIMVWQDFMFANMDYPFDDPDFAASATQEVRQQLDRLAPHPSVVAWCGGSEIEQQAAMFGADPEIWPHAFLADDLPALVEERSPGAPYWSSTPTGGALPFHTGEGITHYWGVGAYRRPLEDARLSRVRFTPECLGFSNLPEDDVLREMADGRMPAPHEPVWKRGVPRDSAAGWDFEDVRDHYLGRLYGVDPIALRSEDPVRYRRLSRAVTGRVMSTVFDEWRSPAHPCGGGLVWFLRDLRPGSGWGVLDHQGRPKPVYYYLKRAWSPLRVAVLDRGLDGLRIDVHNESADEIRGELSVSLYGPLSTPRGEGSVDVTIPARSVGTENVEGILGRFADPTWAYRFGPRAVACVAVRFVAPESGLEVTTVWWSTLATPLAATELSARQALDGGGVDVGASSLARDVRLELDQRPDESYVDLVPGVTRRVPVVGTTDGPVSGFVDAENDPTGSRIAPVDG